MPIILMQDGTPIHYRDQGTGAVLVLLHGLMMTADGFWTRNLDALAERCRVIAVDHRSHGLSGKPLEGHSISQCARDLREVLDALDVQDVTLAGVAFGAMVMLEYRRQFGNHRLGKLAIIEAQVRLTNAEDWEHPTFGDFPAEGGAAFVAACRESRDALQGFLAGAFGTPPDDEEMARMQHQGWLTPTAAAIEYIEDMLAADYRQDLPGVDLPTLLLYGRGNNVPLPTEIGRWIQTQIPGSRFESLDRSGHSPQYEEPEYFNSLLADFVTGS